ncbi:proton-conducting transporter membrane subunit [Fundidesulfovibrio butyratiphilus]
MDFLVSMPVGLPALAAALALVPGTRPRGPVVCCAVALLAAAGLGLAWRSGWAHVPPTFGGASLTRAAIGVDLLLLAGIAFAAVVRTKDAASGVLAAVQAAVLFTLTRSGGWDFASAAPGLVAGPLSRVAVLVVSLVGGLAVVCALGTMPDRERRLGLVGSRQPRFFFFLLLSLAAANGVMLSDNLLWLHCFWVLSTVCAAALLAYDGDEGARQGAVQALRTNLAGATAMLLGLTLLYRAGAPLSVGELVDAGSGAVQVRLLLPLFLLCAAGLAASAQVPLQGWLFEASSAPAPALALVHCATLAPAGAFLALRLCPAFQGTMLSGLLGLAGAFTFLAASTLAVGQTDAGRTLVRSTAAALGLALACAGINTAAAVTAGLLILIFHAVSKALLFVCLAVMEEKTGLRDVADMGRLFAVMPSTALAALIGALSMFLPPFGLALGLWMALEAATGARAMPVLLLLALGTGFWVLLWSRWAGVLLRSLRLGDAPTETLSPAVRVALSLLAGGAVALSLCSPPLYTGLVVPAVRASHKAVAYVLRTFNFVGDLGVFPVYPLFVVLGLGAVVAWRAAAARPDGPAEKPRPEGAIAHEDDIRVDAPLALDGLFDENRLSGPINTAGIVLLAVMLGAVWGGLV